MQKSISLFVALAATGMVVGMEVPGTPILRVNPMEKVQQLMDNLRMKIIHEGDQEAESYEKFACFCKRLGDTKNHEILQEKVLKANLQAAQRRDTTKRAEEDEIITTKTQIIQQVSAEIKEMNAEFAATTKEYDANSVDLSGAMANLESSIQMLRVTQTTNSQDTVALAQMQPVTATIRKALSLAESLQEKFPGAPVNEKNDQVLTSLLSLGQDPLERDMSDLDYDFKSVDVIGTLQSLQSDFRAKKTEIDATYLEAKQSHETLLADKTQLRDSEQAALDEHRAVKAALTAQIQQAEFDYSATNAELIEDVKYLEELRWKCHQKAVLWDQRVALRYSEIEAVQSAINTVNSINVTDATQASSFLQLAQLVTAPVSSVKASEKKLAVVQQVQQVSSEGAKAKLDLGRRARLTSLLKAAAARLNSKTLQVAAQSASEDPWGKVKDLLQELVEGFLKQTQEEATHKGWCDKEFATAKQNRDYKVEQIRDVNTKLEASEARRGELASLLEGIARDLQQANDTLKEAQERRETERLEAAAAIQEASTAKVGVETAIKVLKDFYAAATGASVEFQKRNVTVPENLYTTPENTSYVNEEFNANVPSSFMQLSLSTTNSSNTSKLTYDQATKVPETGFDDVYTGQQGQASGVVNMLEVLDGDFASTVRDIQKSEEANELQLEGLTKDTEVLVASKETAQASRMASKRDADAEDEDNRLKLADYQASLNKILEQLAEVDEACNTGGMTLEERKQKREEEIAALNKGLCILNAHAFGDVGDC